MRGGCFVLGGVFCIYFLVYGLVRGVVKVAWIDVWFGGWKGIEFLEADGKFGGVLVSLVVTIERFRLGVE